MRDEEWRKIENLNKDDLLMILPANKGRVIAVMKCNGLLKDEKTYLKLKSDPTNKFKKEFVSNLKGLKDRKVIDHALHMKFYLMVDQPSKFYGLPKVHKANVPMRPIVSSIGTITYQCAWYLRQFCLH